MSDSQLCRRTENGERKTERTPSVRRTGDGSVEGLPCGADTKVHEGPRRDTKHAAKGTADFADLLQIKGVLAHAGLPEWIGNHKGHEGKLAD